MYCPCGRARGCDYSHVVNTRRGTVGLPCEFRASLGHVTEVGAGQGSRPCGWRHRGLWSEEGTTQKAAVTKMTDVQSKAAWSSLNVPGMCGSGQEKTLQNYFKEENSSHTLIEIENSFSCPLLYNKPL